MTDSASLKQKALQNRGEKVSDIPSDASAESSINYQLPTAGNSDYYRPKSASSNVMANGEGGSNIVPPNGSNVPGGGASSNNPPAPIPSGFPDNKTVIVKFLSDGSGDIMNGSDLLRESVAAFKCGDAAGFIPTGNETGPVGNITYPSASFPQGGGRDSIQVKSDLNSHKITIIGIIPENADNVVIGNIVFYVIDSDTKELTPAIIMVLPQAMVKQNLTDDITDLGYKYPGTRAVITLTIQYLDLSGQDTSASSVTIAAPALANLPIFPTMEQVPSPRENPYSQFIVNSVEQYNNCPALITVKDGEYYTTPLFQNVGSPKYGVINSAVDNGHYQWVWGLTFAVPNGSYREIAGGLSFAAEDNTNAVILGGSSFL